jgi:hypothetical protein
LVQLTLQGASSPLTDEATVYLQAGATAGFEPAYDAEKLPNSTGLNLAASVAGRLLAIAGEAELGASPRVVPLALAVPAAGRYTLTATQLLNLSTVPVYLRDLHTGALVDLAQQPSYAFTVAAATTLAPGRFELVFSPRQVLATAPAVLAQQVSLYPNPATSAVTLELPPSLSRQPVVLTLANAVGQVVRQQALPAGLAAHQMPLAGVASGAYTLRLTTPLGTIVRQLLVE